jgi:hypothetical protein
MVSDIIKKKLVGREVAPSPYPKGIQHDGFDKAKMKSKTDKRIPKGFRHKELAKIPIKHYNLKAAQDMFEDAIVKEIRSLPPGPRRDFVERDYDLWIANGRPTYGEFDPAQYKAINKNEVRRAWQEGKPVFMDVKDDVDDKRLRRLLKVDK